MDLLPAERPAWYTACKSFRLSVLLSFCPSVLLSFCPQVQISLSLVDSWCNLTSHWLRVEETWLLIGWEWKKPGFSLVESGRNLASHWLRVWASLCLSCRMGWNRFQSGTAGCDITDFYFLSHGHSLAVPSTPVCHWPQSEQVCACSAGCGETDSNQVLQEVTSQISISFLMVTPLLGFTVQHCASQYSTVLHNTRLYFTIQHCASQYSTVLHSIALCFTVQHCASQYSSVLHSTALCFTVQHCASQHSSVLHSTALWNIQE